MVPVILLGQLFFNELVHVMCPPSFMPNPYAIELYQIEYFEEFIQAEIRRNTQEIYLKNFVKILLYVRPYVGHVHASFPARLSSVPVL